MTIHLVFLLLFPITPLLESLHWVPISQSIFCLDFKVIHDCPPSAWLNFFPTVSQYLPTTPVHAMLSTISRIQHIFPTPAPYPTAFSSHPRFSSHISSSGRVFLTTWSSLFSEQLEHYTFKHITIMYS